MSNDRTAGLEIEIEAQRDHLAATVDQLTHKLDVKAQARERIAGLKERVTTETGKPRPALIATGIGGLALACVLVWWRWR